MQNVVSGDILFVQRQDVIQIGGDMALKITKRKATPRRDLGLVTDCTGLYIRVSTDKQAEEGFSLEDQQARLTAYCMAQGWELCPEHIYVDKESGKSTARDNFLAMLHAAEAGDLRRVVVLKLDRIARNTADFLSVVKRLQARGCDLVIVKENFDSSTPQGKFALTMFAAIAELELSTIHDRTMSGRRQKAASGGYNGGPAPYGYTYDGEVWTTTPAAAIVRRIFAAYNAGQSMNGIAQALNRDDVPTAKSGVWDATKIRYILRNGFYAGLIQYDGQEMDGGHPAIVSIEEYRAAVARLYAARPGNPDWRKGGTCSPS